MVRSQLLIRLVVLSAVLVPFGWYFGSVLSGSRFLAYRDSATFYYPNYQWISDRWAAGELPLWNPQANIGTPVVAETTSAVFYPGKLLFALPLSDIVRFNVYVAAHLLLAAVTAFLLARRWKMSMPAAGLCGVSYAFSGVVAFQYCNVVFLVGAAWLPVTLLATDQMLRQRSHFWAIALGMSLACMTLGGDPQTAYHAGLLAVLWVLLQVVQHRRAASVPRPARSARSPRLVWRDSDSGLRTSWFRHPICLLLLAAGSGAMLAAVQIVPAADWTRESRRAAFGSPRSVYEIPGYLARETARETARSSSNASYNQPAATGGNHGLATAATVCVTRKDGICVGIFGDPQPSTHHRQLYDFSVEPWRLVETIWPNFSGRLFPRNGRWLSALSAEGRIWTPSLYFGIAPLLLMLRVWRLRRRVQLRTRAREKTKMRMGLRSFLLKKPPLPSNPASGGKEGSSQAGWKCSDSVIPPGNPMEQRVRWLSWIVLLGVLGSFGWYGLGWAANEIYSVWAGNRTDLGVGGPTGGLYWLMVVGLPGYVYFRYPAKLLVVAGLGLSALAGFGLDRILASVLDRLAFRRNLAVVGVISLTAALVVGVSWPLFEQSMAAAPADELFGPFQMKLGQLDAIGACLHTAVICGVMWWLVGFRALRASTLGCLILLVTAVELAWANGGLILTAPVSALQIARQPGDLIPSTFPVPRLYRPARRRWVPSSWLTSSSEQRPSQVLEWDFRTLYPNFHLLGPCASLTTHSSIAQRDYYALFDAAPLCAEGMNESYRAVLDLLGVNFLLLPANQLPDEDSSRELISPSQPENVRLWRNRSAFPRAWVVHDVEYVPGVDSKDPGLISQHTGEILFPNGRPRDFRQIAVVELQPGQTPFPLQLPGPGQTSGETCELVAMGSNRVEINAVLRSPGLVVLSDQFQADWIVEVTTDASAPTRRQIVRTNRIMRGVFLDGGQHRLVYRYVPRRFYWALAVSCIAWLLCLVLALSHWMGSRRMKREIIAASSLGAVRK